MKDMLEKAYFDSIVTVTSRATSREEEGNPVYPGAMRKLAENGLSCKGKYSTVITPAEMEENDLIVAMDQSNLRNIERIAMSKGSAFAENVMKKSRLLLSFVGRSGSIADPWYTGDFEQTWQDVNEGCRGLIKYLIEEGVC